MQFLRWRTGVGGQVFCSADPPLALLYVLKCPEADTRDMFRLQEHRERNITITGDHGDKENNWVHWSILKLDKW